MGKMSQLYLEMQEQHEPDDYDYFILSGSVEPLTMEDYMRESGDTLYHMDGKYPELLDFDF
jgi:hypothetical protein